MSKILVLYYSSHGHIETMENAVAEGALPYSFQNQLKLDEVSGGSPYGATTITAGDGSRQPSTNEVGVPASSAGMWPA
jgi:multimeric flavodoxin WrbA